jgi:hypothetical protein
MEATMQVRGTEYRITVEYDERFLPYLLEYRYTNDNGTLPMPVALRRDDRYIYRAYNTDGEVVLISDNRSKFFAMLHDGKTGEYFNPVYEDYWDEPILSGWYHPKGGRIR